MQFLINTFCWSCQNTDQQINLCRNAATKANGLMLAEHMRTGLWQSPCCEYSTPFTSVWGGLHFLTVNKTSVKSKQNTKSLIAPFFPKPGINHLPWLPESVSPMAYCHACSLADKPLCEPGCLDVMVLPYLPEATSRLGWREYQLGWETLNSQTTCWSEHLQGSHTVCYTAQTSEYLL